MTLYIYTYTYMYVCSLNETFGANLIVVGLGASRHTT